MVQKLAYIWGKIVSVFLINFENYKLQFRKKIPTIFSSFFAQKNTYEKIDVILGWNVAYKRLLQIKGMSTKRKATFFFSETESSFGLKIEKSSTLKGYVSMRRFYNRSWYSFFKRVLESVILISEHPPRISPECLPWCHGLQPFKYSTGSI